MTTDDDLDHQIRTYLEAGPVELSDRVLWAARAQLKTTRRRDARFAWLTPWRDLHMSQSTRLLLFAGAAFAVIVALGAGVLGPLFGQRDAAPAASPGPSASAPAASPSASSSASPSPSTARIPVYPDEPAGHLTPAWQADGGSPTSFGVPAVGPDGNIWVASSTDDAFRILSPAGQLLETWGTPGSGDGQFEFSVGTDNAGAIAFAPDGSFWVADTGNFRIQRFDKDRRFVSAWGRFGNGDGEFSYPLDIAVDTVGTVFVGDDGRHDIQAFTSDGRYLRTLKPAQFVSANGEGWALTNVLPDGRPGLVEYQPDGTVQGGMDMPGFLPHPMGTTRDAERNIYAVGVTDTDAAGNLVRFAMTGELLNVWDCGGLAVAVSPAGDAAYVLKVDGGTIQRCDLPLP